QSARFANSNELGVKNRLSLLERIQKSQGEPGSPPPAPKAPARPNQPPAAPSGPPARQNPPPLPPARSAPYSPPPGQLPNHARPPVQRATEVLDAYLSARRVTLTTQTRDRLLGALLADILGFGPLDLLLADETISDIMVNGPSKVYIERGNKMQRAAIRFDSDAHLMQIISRIVTGVGRRVDESSPMVDARLPDGSRVNVIIPPLAVRGASVTIRQMSRDPLQITDLIKNQTLTDDMA